MEKKDRKTAAILALFLGTFGVHFFYMNRPDIGVVCLLLFITGASTLIGFISFVALCFMDDKTFDELVAARPATK